MIGDVQDCIISRLAQLQSSSSRSGYNSIWDQRAKKEDRPLEGRGHGEKNEALHVVKEINWARDMATLIFTVHGDLLTLFFAMFGLIVFILYTILSGNIAVFEGLAGNKRGFILFCARDNSFILFQHFFFIVI